MLYNISKQTTIIENLRFAHSHMRKLRGLMFVSPSSYNYGLVFDFNKEVKVRAAIHMLFVFVPIDVVYLDSNKDIVDMAQNIRPFTPYYIPKHKARYLIELPVNSLAHTSLGDRLKW